MRWEEGDYHGRHVPVGRDSPMIIKWKPEVPRNRVRVVQYTCDCMPVVYELCKAGGITFIRRTDRSRTRTLVEEFTTTPDSLVTACWDKLLQNESITYRCEAESAPRCGRPTNNDALAVAATVPTQAFPNRP